MKKIKNFLEKHQNFKYALRRFLKIFLNAFLVTGFTFIESFDGGKTILLAFQKDIGSGFVAVWYSLIGPFLLSSSIAGIAAVAKYIRSIYPEIKSKLLKLVADIF